MRPSEAIKHKPAAEAQDSEIGGFTLGEQLPIADIWKDENDDIAAIKLEPSFVLPDAVEVYDVFRSRELMSWEDKKLEGLSLMLFGFPVGNSREVFRGGRLAFRFIGCAEYLSEYSVGLNNTAWSQLHSKHSKSKDFVFKYDGIWNDLKPHGFSGGGVWVLSERRDAAVWRPDPLLIGLVHHFAPKARLLIAAKLSTIFEIEFAPSDSSSTN
jgi:hypothetical protein